MKLRIVENNNMEKYVHIPNLFSQYGPTKTIREFTLSYLLSECKRDRATIVGDDGSRYMTVLLFHYISGTVFDKVIFSDSLIECKQEAESYLDTGFHKQATGWEDETHYFALVYDIQNDKVIMFENVYGDRI